MSRETGGKEFACQARDAIQSLGQEDALVQLFCLFMNFFFIWGEK